MQGVILYCVSPNQHIFVMQCSQAELGKILVKFDTMNAVNFKGDI